MQQKTSTHQISIFHLRPRAILYACLFFSSKKLIYKLLIEALNMAQRKHLVAHVGEVVVPPLIAQGHIYPCSVITINRHLSLAGVQFWSYLLARFWVFVPSIAVVSFLSSLLQSFRLYTSCIRLSSSLCRVSVHFSSHCRLKLVLCIVNCDATDSETHSDVHGQISPVYILEIQLRNTALILNIRIQIQTVHVLRFQNRRIRKNIRPIFITTYLHVTHVVYLLSYCFWFWRASSLPSSRHAFGMHG